MLIEASPRILVIEDEIAIRRFLKTVLLSQGYTFIETGNGKDAFDIVCQQKPDIILLDLGLPDMTGIQVIKQLRTWTSIPIIIISAKDQEKDKVLALDEGADDYLTKPFSIQELQARIRVALRHAERINQEEMPLYRYQQLEIDLLNRQVMFNQTPIVLSPIQFAILSVLAKKANKIVTHKELLKAVWGESHTEDVEYLRIYIYQLRHKLEPVPTNPQYLKTEPGVGYRLMGE